MRGDVEMKLTRYGAYDVGEHPEGSFVEYDDAMAAIRAAENDALERAASHFGDLVFGAAYNWIIDELRSLKHPEPK
jgi:hypothetical protein